QSDETPHRTVRLARRLTFARRLSSYWREEHIIQRTGKLSGVMTGHASTGGEQQLPTAVACRCARRKAMTDHKAIADRIDIEALRGEFTDAVMMRDLDRLTSLFTHHSAGGMSANTAAG